MRLTWVQAIAGSALSAWLLSGMGCDVPDLQSCSSMNGAASIDVAGVYDYFGETEFLLKGTIVFEQEGALVRVTDTTYENSNDRGLMGEAMLDGNFLEMALVPTSGEPEFRADVLFVFDENGDTFCVEFSDTNGDSGSLGTYRGVRQ